MKWFEAASYAAFFGLIALFASYAPAQALMHEDGPVENLSALFWAIGACLSIYAAVALRGKHRTFYILAAVVCVTAFGEEISWGQRALGIETPEFFAKHNMQSEISIHNLYVLSGGSTWRQFFATGRFDYRQILDAQNLFRLCFYTYFLVLPLLCLNKRAERRLTNVGYVVPNGYSLICLWGCIALVYLVTLGGDPTHLHRGQEIREMLFAFCATTYLFHAYRVHASKRARP